MNYKVIDKETYYRKGVFRHFSEDCKCSTSMTARVDVTDLVEYSGIESSGQHALRHTFATRCIEAGIPAVVLKTWLGHKDIHMTLDTYTDVFKAMDNDAISKYDEHLNSM